MTVENKTLDGATTFTSFGRTFTWSARTIENVSIGNFGSVTNDTLNLTMTGAVWRIRRLSLDSESQAARLDVNLTDTNDGVERRIDWLQLGDYSNTTVTLYTSRIRFIDGGIGGNFTLNLGSGGLNHAALWETDSNTINLGSGYADAIYLGDGTNVVNGGAGWLGLLEMGEGSNTFVGGSGNFGTIRAWGTNNLTFNNGGDGIFVGSGNSTITLNNGFFGAITGYDEAFTVNTITVGAGVEVRSIGFSGGKETVVLGDGANVEQMQLGGNNDSLTLQGNAYVSQVNMGDGTNSVSVGAGEIGALTGSGGKDTVTLTSGWVSTMALGGGNNVLNVGAGHVQTVIAYDGNDTFTVGSGMIEMLSMGEGNNKLTVGNGGYANVVRGDGGDDTVTLNGDARILMLKLDGGNNTLTTADGNVESYYSYGGNNTLNIGSGGIQQVVLSGDGGTHVVNATGFVGSLQVYDNASSTVTLNGGAIWVLTGLGADRVTIGSGSYVGTLFTWQSDDQITIAAGATLEYGHFGKGNDLVKLSSVGAGEVNDLRGADGIDTLDFSQAAAGVTISLAKRGEIQTLGTGEVALSGFENLIGSAQADRFTGSADANRIEGRSGADVLIGGAGADTLIGGVGADTLTGGADADVFEFSPTAGRDRITDFVELTDKIRITNATVLGDITFTQSGSHVLLTCGTTEVLVLNSTVAEMNQAGNFLF